MRGVQKKQRESKAAGSRAFILEQIEEKRVARDMCTADGDLDGALNLEKLIGEHQSNLAAAVTNDSAVVDHDGDSDAWSATEESDSDDGRTRTSDSTADKILRQLRGAKEP